MTLTATASPQAASPEFLRELQLRILSLESLAADLRQLVFRHTAIQLPASAQKPTRRLAAHQICDLVVDYVANYYDINREVFFRTTRGANKVAECRWQCITLCRQFTTGNTVQLGAYFHCNHSTIANAGKRCADLCETDPAYARNYELIRENLTRVLKIATAENPQAAMEECGVQQPAALPVRPGLRAGH